MKKKDPQSMVCFPFKKENTQVVLKNMREALAHPRVGEVLGVGYEKNECFKEIEAELCRIEKKGKKIHLMVQKRWGKKRPGKGDGMNTALDYFVNHTSFDRIHFYDADIVSFSSRWIERGEERLEGDYQVVRFFFPKVSTDGMITWNITRCGLAYNWPHTILPRIEQPLGGELVLKRKIAERLIKDCWVMSYSDWGIDTAYALAFAKYQAPLYDAYINQGKLHKLYGSLSDLYTMLIECFAIIQESSAMPINTESTLYKKDRVEKIPASIQKMRAFDVKGTIPLLTEDWTEEGIELLNFFPSRVKEGMRSCRNKVDVRFMDAQAWYEVYEVLLEKFNQNKRAWRDLLFRLWIARVLNHTFYYASKGYGYGMKSLEDMVSHFVHRKLKGK
ncbi:MAG: mannosylglycerate synthase domain-containing protein [bacterium]